MIVNLQRCVAIAAVTMAGLGSDALAYKPATHIDMHVRVEGIEDYPKFDFYLKYAEIDATGGLVELRLIPVLAGSRAHIKAERISPVVLLAVPHGQELGRPPLAPGNKEWLRNVPPGGLQSAALITLPDGRLFPGSTYDTRRRNSEIVYEVRIVDHNLEAVCVEWKNPNGFPWGDCTTVLFAGLSFLGLAFLGIMILKVVARRRAHPTTAASNETPGAVEN